MLFLSGFVGIEQTSEGFIKPRIGWAIAQKTEIEEKKQKEECHEEEEGNKEN